MKRIISIGKNYFPHKIIRLLSVAMLLAFGQVCYAQEFTFSITGSNNVNAGETKTYEVEFLDSFGRAVRPPSGTATWSSFGGALQSSTNESCSILWGAGGNGQVTCQYLTTSFTYEAIFYVQIASTTPPKPDPGVVTVVNNCGNVTVTRSNSPEGWMNCDWYWQTSRTGQSTTLGSLPSITVTSGTELFIRARSKASPYHWSEAPDEAIANFQVFSSPPPTPTVANNTSRFGVGEITISVGPVAGAIKYVWVDEKSGNTIAGQTGNSYTIPNVTKTISFEVHSSNGCVSTSFKRVTATVLPLPVVQSVGDPVIGFGESVQLTTGEYDQYVWKLDGVVIGGGQTINVNQPGSYMVTVTSAGITGSSLPFIVEKKITSANKNYVISEVMKKAMTEESTKHAQSNDLLDQTIEYFDGLGRPFQTVFTQHSGSKTDLVQPREYDVYGREETKYLPYASESDDGSFKANSVVGVNGYGDSDHHAFYSQENPRIARSNFPFSKNVFETSPLNRIVQKGSAGEDWQPSDNSATDHSVRKAYKMNAVEEVIRLIYDEETEKLDLSTIQFYAASDLFADHTVDENGHEAIEFFDKEGKLILRKAEYRKELDYSQEDSEVVRYYAETYFVYDRHGNLIMVLPPEAVKEMKKQVNE